MLNNILEIFLFPEIAMSIMICALLLIGLFLKENSFKKTTNFSILALILLGFLTTYNLDISFANYKDFFTNSNFIQFIKILIILGSFITLIISKDYFIDTKIERFEIPILILFSTLGMMVLVSSNDLISMYLGIELQSLALYVLASIKRDSLKSAEAGVKYFVLGALSSGILLYGCSLIYGFSGSTNFDDIQQNLLLINDLNLGLLFGLIFVLVGLAFKVSAVPFHMWTPDVYEGSPTSITAFFSIVPKISAVALIYRFCLEPFKNFYSDWSQIIIFLAIASMFLGAIAAINQTNIKRLLAYSSIGHIGYILIGLAAANEAGIKGLSIYLVIYLLMNTAIFSILLALKCNNKFIEQLEDFAGLSKVKPLVSLSIAIIMLSMAGIPPFAGFFGKFYIFIAALESELFILAILGVISSVISAYYYLRIIKIIYFDENKNSNFQFIASSSSLILLIISIIIISFFIFYPSILISLGSNISIDYFN